MEDDLKIIKFEYLSNHWSDPSQMLKLSSVDQRKFKMLEPKKNFWGLRGNLEGNSRGNLECGSALPSLFFLSSWLSFLWSGMTLLYFHAVGNLFWLIERTMTWWRGSAMMSAATLTAMLFNSSILVHMTQRHANKIFR